jgi:lipid-A-disaccharide synthase
VIAAAPGEVRPAGRRIMLSSGEASGDLYAGALVRALRAADPQLEAFAFGGPQLAEAGAELIGDYRGFSVTGLVEAARVLPRSWAMLRRLARTARSRRPDVFVAVDFPDFNFQLLPSMHRLGIPIVYYVSPQLWAWRPGRVAVLRRHVSRMLVIFPFETRLYEDAGVPVEFVGHPLVETMAAGGGASWLTARGLDPARPVLALLPGSRPNEVRRILPTLVEAAPLIARAVPGVQFLVARAPSLDPGLFVPLARRSGEAAFVIDDSADGVLASADAVVTASGTATVQAALHDRPMVIVYRVSPLTYAIGRRMVRVRHFGMVNLIAERPVVPELIQEAFTPEAVAREAVSLLTDRARASAMRRDLAEVRTRLGGAGASARAAAAVLAACARSTPGPAV